MDIYTIINDLTTAVSKNTDISSWSTITYERNCTIMENMDLREPPLPQSCPMVVFFPIRKATGIGQPSKKVSIGVTCLVYDDAKPVDINNVTRFAGGRNVEQLRKYVLESIINFLQNEGNLELVEVDMDYNSIEQYPYNDISMELVITSQQVIGGNYYE